MNALRDDLSRMISQERDDVVDRRLVRQTAHADAVSSLAGSYQLRRQRRRRRHQAVKRRQSEQSQLGGGARDSRIATWIHVAIQHLQRTDTSALVTPHKPD